MNKIAKDLGLTHTRFVDPTGLRGNQSTAREMALALRAALDDKVLREIMGTPEATIVSRIARRASTTTRRTCRSPRTSTASPAARPGSPRPPGTATSRAPSSPAARSCSCSSARPAVARFDDFSRVAAWLERGAPGSRLASKRPKRAPAAEDGPARHRERARRDAISGARTPR